MGNLNKVMLIGRLGQDPEKRITPQGHSVVTVSLATSERFTDRAGTKQERTEWHRVVFWNRQADVVEKYCKKGSQLYVEGSIHTNEWQDKDGNKRYTTEIQGRSLEFLDSSSERGGQQGGQGGQGWGAAPAASQPQGGPAPAQGGYPQGGYAPQGGYPQGGGYQQPRDNQPPVGPGPNDDFIEDDIPF